MMTLLVPTESSRASTLRSSCSTKVVLSLFNIDAMSEQSSTGSSYSVPRHVSANKPHFLSTNHQLSSQPTHVTSQYRPALLLLLQARNSTSKSTILLLILGSPYSKYGLIVRINRRRQSLITTSKVNLEISIKATKLIINTSNIKSIFKAPITTKGIVRLLINCLKYNTLKKRIYI